MKINKETIEHIAKLARLNLTEFEKTKYAEELSVVFDYIEDLNKIDTENISETFQVVDLKNVVRDDKTKKTNLEQRKKIIENFPEKEMNLLKVKTVFDNLDE